MNIRNKASFTSSLTQHITPSSQDYFWSNPSMTFPGAHIQNNSSPCQNMLPTLAIISLGLLRWNSNPTYLTRAYLGGYMWMCGENTYHSHDLHEPQEDLQLSLQGPWCCTTHSQSGFSINLKINAPLLQTHRYNSRLKELCNCRTVYKGPLGSFNPLVQSGSAPDLSVNTTEKNLASSSSFPPSRSL